jgi:hypothetical protein
VRALPLAVRRQNVVAILNGIIYSYDISSILGNVGPSVSRYYQIIGSFPQHRWGSSLLGLRTLAPLLSPPSTLAKKFQRNSPGRRGSIDFLTISGDSKLFSFFPNKKTIKSPTLEFFSST